MLPHRCHLHAPLQKIAREQGFVHVRPGHLPQSRIVPGPVARAADSLRWPRRLLLCFHAVDETWPNPSLSVPPSRFERFLERLSHAGFRGATFGEIAHHRGRDRLVAITFDDAYTSVHSVAAPLLDRLGWPATVFVPTAPLVDGAPLYWVGTDIQAQHPVATAQLGWGALSDLARRGWEIGSHSRTHRLLSRLDDAELTHELAGSREEIAAQVGRCDSVSYPWGEVDDRVAAAARRVGYSAGSGLAGRFTWSDELRVPRVAIAGDDGPRRFALKSSRAFWALRATPLWHTLDAARGLGGARDADPVTPPRKLARRLGFRGRT
jgi:peptidoglycan/xylan/chitin deacetylase (PgdA/CDA1 family)